MKTTEEQRQWLQAYLNAVLKYRETYEEVYDHILAALENKPEQKFFETSVNDVITDDFGGTYGLMVLENKCKTAATNEVYHQYQGYGLSFFKLPLVIFTVLVALAAYLAGYIFFKPVTLVFAWMISAVVMTLIIPVLLIFLRRLKLRYTFGNNKGSMKDSILKGIAYRPLIFFLTFYWITSIFNLILKGLLSDKLHFDYSIFTTPVVLITWFLALTIHTLSFFKLMNKEFKTNLTINAA